jgi:hypothetical protein
MLFDLRGKRKRLVQVSYALLAAIFLIGFVGLGIGVGGGGPGGLLDAIGLGGNSTSGAGAPQFNDQVDAANAKLAKDPKDTQALLKLAKYEYFNAKAGLPDPSTGQTTVSEDAVTDLNNSSDAWQKYLKVNKGEPNAGVATLMTQVYTAQLQNDLSTGEAVDALGVAKDAAQAQQLAAAANPSANAYTYVAQLAYIAGDEKTAKKASAQALAKSQGSTKKTTQSFLKQAKKQGQALNQALVKAVKSQGTGSQQLQNPLGVTPSGSSTP